MAQKTAKKDRDITYSSYLRLSGLLKEQRPLTPAHDEMLFITVHQTYELWFKQVLFELDRVQELFSRKKVADKDLRVIASSLSRIVDILRLMVRQLDILETMTPLDFLDFRHVFRSASGFQSLQFRRLEIRLGLRRDDRVTYDGKGYDIMLAAEDKKALRLLEKKQSLFEQLDIWLARTPFLSWQGYNFWDSYRTAVLDMIENDRMLTRSNKNMSPKARKLELAKLDNTQKQFSLLLDGPKKGQKTPWRFGWRAMQAALFINLYRDQPALQVPYSILAALMDIDETLTLWRYRHALMAQRMLGTKMGSGGSSGHDYLAQSTAKHRIFFDLFSLSTFLIPRSKLPPLPNEIEAQTGFRYETDA